MCLLSGLTPTVSVWSEKCIWWQARREGGREGASKYNSWLVSLAPHDIMMDLRTSFLFLSRRHSSVGPARQWNVAVAGAGRTEAPVESETPVHTDVLLSLTRQTWASSASPTSSCACQNIRNWTARITSEWASVCLTARTAGPLGRDTTHTSRVTTR